MVGSFACCARAASGHATAAPPRTRRKVRRLMSQPRLRSSIVLTKTSTPEGARGLRTLVDRGEGCRWNPSPRDLAVFSFAMNSVLRPVGLVQVAGLGDLQEPTDSGHAKALDKLVAADFELEGGGGNLARAGVVTLLPVSRRASFLHRK